MTKGALFHHFNSKQDLFTEVWRECQIGMDASANAAAIAARSKTDPFAAFLAGCREYIRFLIDPEFRRIAMVDGPGVLGAEEWHKQDAALGLSTIEAGVGYLSHKGLIEANRVHALSLLLFGALTEAGFALGRGDTQTTADELLENFEHILRSVCL